VTPPLREGSWLLEPLSPDHEIEDFTCGEREVDDYLHQQALSDMKIAAAATRVLVEAGSNAVRGYFTLVNCQVVRNELPGRDRRGRRFRRHVPATLLAQLAISSDLQGSGAGTHLLMQAMNIAAMAAELSGSFVLVLDAATERAAAWYQRFGFRRLNDDENPTRLFITIPEIRDLGIESTPATDD
jgi:ribosomal protein S18 acetylase RimI-like enzyme